MASNNNSGSRDIRFRCPNCGSERITFSHKDDIGSEWYVCDDCKEYINSKKLRETRIKEPNFSGLLKPPPERWFTIRVKCGLCSKFHTRKCRDESLEDLKQGLYRVSEDDEAPPTCFEPEPSNLMQLLAEEITYNFTVKHFVKDGSSLGLYMWNGGKYEEAEEYLKSWIERFAIELGIEPMVRCRVVREAIEKAKRMTYTPLKEEPLMIAFKNYAFDWGRWVNGDCEGAILPLEETKERICFHYIPHNLNIELLKEYAGRLKDTQNIEDILGELAPISVKVFKEWCGEAYLALFEVIGYTLYPSYSLNRALMLVGEGSNGKTTYLRLLTTILGEHNYVSISLQELCMNRFAPANLYHKLANIYADIPSKPLEYTGYFKMLTGEDVVSADRKFRDRITFRNYAKLIFSANELPGVSDMTYAFWRRWILIEFPNKFPNDNSFFERTFVETEIEKVIVCGILAFTRALSAKKFSVEGEASDFKEKWMRKANSVYGYVRGRGEEGRLILKKRGEEEEREESERLYLDYNGWCEENDVTPVSKQTFTKELERLFGIEKTRLRDKGERKYFYKGIKLLEENEKVTLTKEKIGSVLEALKKLSVNGREAHKTEISRETLLSEDATESILTILKREMKAIETKPGYYKPL